jgi:hypothetical protein
VLDGCPLPLGIKNPRRSPRTAIEVMLMKSRLSIKYFKVFFFNVLPPRMLKHVEDRCFSVFPSPKPNFVLFYILLDIPS